LWRPFEADVFLFLTTQSPDDQLFIAHSGDDFKSALHIVPCGISAASGKSVMPASAIGEGALGPSGPRTGNSSGTRPGSSSGCGGSPGSRIGGGTSGCGLPGGLSCGGSDGCPGLIGGSSRGSIGMFFCFPGFQSETNGAAAAMFPAKVLCKIYPRSNSVLLRVLPASA
jgi:hypothetical protein